MFRSTPSFSLLLQTGNHTRFYDILYFSNGLWPHLDRCNVSSSPTDVSPTENSWMMRPQEKESLGYWAPDRTIPKNTLSEATSFSPSSGAKRQLRVIMCGPSLHLTEGYQPNRKGKESEATGGQGVAKRHQLVFFLYMEQTCEETQLKSPGPVRLKKPSYLLGLGMKESTIRWKICPARSSEWPNLETFYSGRNKINF